MTSQTEMMALVLFVIAILHTFSVKTLTRLARRFPEGSVGENLFHLLGEVEVVFGFWSFILFLVIWFNESYAVASHYIESRIYTEPLFIFAIMVVAATKPVIQLASRSIMVLSNLLPFSKPMAFYATCLIIGPLLGSVITEPAAMTVTAMILVESLFQQKLTQGFKHATLALLFVNVSIGGTLTHFAAPPVVMVANLWNWSTPFMFVQFGWKAIIAIFISTLLMIWRFRAELQTLQVIEAKTKTHSPFLMSLIHILFLALIVLTGHQPKLFLSVLMFFLGFAAVTKEYQTDLKIREGLLVSFFLGGVVTLGGAQIWWVDELIKTLDSWILYLSSGALTTIFDNAALTYLGSLARDISEPSKYALVAGAVVGGGMTVIANAPNPIGYSILNVHFGKDGINPISLFLESLMPTLIAGLAFWFL